MRFQFEAMNATGQEIRDTIEEDSESAAQRTIRKMGYFVTKINRIDTPPEVKEEAEPKQYPGVGRLLVDSVFGIIKDTLYTFVACVVLACIIWFFGKLFAQEWTFFGVQRWTIVIGCALVAGTDFIRMVMLYPLLVGALAKKWDVPFGMAYAGIKAGYMKKYPEEEDRNKETLERFLWCNELAGAMSQTITKAILDGRRKGLLG